MSQITRYERDHCYGDMSAQADGLYVLFSDHEKAMRELSVQLGKRESEIARLRAAMDANTRAKLRAGE